MLELHEKRLLVMDSKPLEIYVSGSCSPFCLQKAMLANVSPELVRSATQHPLDISEDGFWIFVTWLVYRDLEEINVFDVDWMNQTSLAEAWNLGAKYHIPLFQNTVMPILTYLFMEEIVEVNTAKEAYRTTKRDTKFQKACVAHLANDSRDPHTTWKREWFTRHDMDKVPGFYLDLVLALTPLAAGSDCDKAPVSTSTL